MNSLNRLQKLLEDKKGHVDIEITSTSWGDWYISVGVQEGNFEGYLSYGDFYESLDEGLQEAIDIIERKKPGAKSILEKDSKPIKLRSVK